MECARHIASTIGRHQFMGSGTPTHEIPRAHRQPAAQAPKQARSTAQPGAGSLTAGRVSRGTSAHALDVTQGPAYMRGVLQQAIMPVIVPVIGPVIVPVQPQYTAAHALDRLRFVFSVVIDASHPCHIDDRWCRHQGAHAAAEACVIRLRSVTQRGSPELGGIKFSWHHGLTTAAAGPHRPESPQPIRPPGRWQQRCVTQSWHRQGRLAQQRGVGRPGAGAAAASAAFQQPAHQQHGR